MKKSDNQSEACPTVGDFMALPLAVRVQISREVKGLRGAKYAQAIAEAVRRESLRAAGGQARLFG